MNRFEFFKNYKEFACYIRYKTANVLCNQLENSRDLNEQRALMLRIVEELAAQTDDLSMWLQAIMQRNDGDKKYRDEWERLLSIRTNHSDSKKVIDSFRRVRSLGGFLRKLDFPPISQIAKIHSTNEILMKEGVDTVWRSVRDAIEQRIVKSRILELVQNKIKHGMMVYTDTNENKIWIRIFKVNCEGTGRKKRLSRLNRNVEIPIDEPKAKSMVGTIKAYGQAIEALINLLLIDYKYKILSKKIRLKRENREKCLDEISKALS